MTIESQGKFDLSHWLKEPEQTKDGALIFYKRDAMSQLQKVAFTKAYCVHLEEEFEAHDEVPIQKHIVISAQTIVIGDMVFENSWGSNILDMDAAIISSRKQRLKKAIDKSLRGLRVGKNGKLSASDKRKIKNTVTNTYQRFLIKELTEPTTKTYDWWFTVDGKYVDGISHQQNMLGKNRYFIIDLEGASIPVDNEFSQASRVGSQRVRELEIYSHEN